MSTLVPMGDPPYRLGAVVPWDVNPYNQSVYETTYPLQPMHPVPLSQPSYTYTNTLPCEHCYCILVPKEQNPVFSQEPHRTCCKCLDRRAEIFIPELSITKSKNRKST